MPANPQSPNSSAAIDRLNLGVDSPRGVEPAGNVWGPCICSDVNPSSVSQHIYFCFEAE